MAVDITFTVDGHCAQDIGFLFDILSPNIVTRGHKLIQWQSYAGKTTSKNVV
jgi:hypothetical protein